jgi:hypothetical protein
MALSLPLILSSATDGQLIPVRQPTTISAEQKAREAYGKLPLSFEANTDPQTEQIKFLARTGGYNLFLADNEMMLSLKKPRPAELEHSAETGLTAPKSSIQNLKSKEPPILIKMKLLDGNAVPTISGQEELPGKINYFIGNDPSKWRTNISIYQKVKYQEVYPGIDLLFYGNQNSQLEYDFVVAPGAEPNVIHWRFEGQKQLELNPDGDLLLHIGKELIVQHAPILYQIHNGNKELLTGRYRLLDDASISFEVGLYDHSRPLVIDPTLIYSTYLGGTGFDQGNSITVDNNGNAYMAGYTDSLNFPLANAVQSTYAGGDRDVIVTKLNPTGSTLIYSTYIGGNSSDVNFGIKVDSSDNVYITGDTSSSNFPTVNALQPLSGGSGDAFITKLNAAGTTLIYSTYLGGSSADAGFDITIDDNTNVYITGDTFSPNFPTASALQPTFGGYRDAFITKINAAGTAIIYSTYLGGSDNDEGASIKVDLDGNAYVVGRTYSSDFPTVNALQPLNGGVWDTFVTKINPADTALIYSTYLGGTEDDKAFDLALDAEDNIYVTGYTTSPNFPTVNALQAQKAGEWDVFITKISAVGTVLIYSTYLGGGGSENGFGIALDKSDNIYVVGQTDSPDFPVVNALQPQKAEGSDIFIIKLGAVGTPLIYSTFLGGKGADYGEGIAVDSSGNAYITGYTNSTDFPVGNSRQALFGTGDKDAFIAKIGNPPIVTTFRDFESDDAHNKPIKDFYPGLSFDPTLPYDRACFYFWDWGRPDTNPQRYSPGKGGIYSVDGNWSAIVAENRPNLSCTIRINQAVFGNALSGDSPFKPHASTFTEVELEISSTGRTTVSAHDDKGRLLDSKTLLPNASRNGSRLDKVRLTGVGIDSITITAEGLDPAATCDVQPVSQPSPLTYPSHSYCLVVDNLRLGKAAEQAAPDLASQLRLDLNPPENANRTDGVSVVALQLAIQSKGTGRTTSFRMEWPIDLHLEVLSASFSDPGGRVTELTKDLMKLELGPIGAGETHGAIIRVAIKPDTPLGTRIIARFKGFAAWEGGAVIESSSNPISFVVRGSNSGDGSIQSLKTTVLPAQTAVLIEGDIFIPEEPIVAWFNLPGGGTQPVDVGPLRADKTGAIKYTYDLIGLASGDYSLVFYGQRSGMQGVASFTVTALLDPLTNFSGFTKR